MGKKWTIERQEALFKLALSYRKPLAPSAEVTKDSASIIAITKKLNSSDIDEQAVLYQLAGMKLFSERKGSRKRGVFYRIKTLDLRWDNYKIGPKPMRLQQDVLASIIQSAQVNLRQAVDIKRFCYEIAGEFGLTPRNIHYQFLSQKLIYRDEYGRYLLANHLSQIMTNKELTKEIKSKIAPKEQVKNINACRAHTSRLFYLKDKPSPALIFCNDGTGTGKSYGQHKAYIDESHLYKEEGGHNNLFFITPLKSQIDFSISLVQEARSKGLTYLPFLSFADMTNLQFKEWVPDDLGNFQTNLERYRRWYKEGKDYSFWKKEIRALNDAIGSLISIDKQLEYAKRYQDEDYQSVLKKQRVVYNRLIGTNLERLAMAAINRNGKPITCLKTFLLKPEGRQDCLCGEVLLHIFPLEFAKLKPTILVATTKKFDYNVRQIKLKKDGSGYTSFAQPFASVIGGKIYEKENLAGNYADKTHAEQLKYIADEMLKIDESNWFRHRNISFTVVIDEEHESYRILAESCKVSLLNKEDSQLADVLAGVYRVLQSVKAQEEKDAFKSSLDEDGKVFIEAISKALAEKCELSNNHTFESIIKIFSNNIGQIFINSGDIEQVVSLAKNVFSFRPKRFFNEAALKNIKVKSLNNDTYIQLYYSEDNDDINPSMHDVYQVILAVLYGASKVPNTSPLKTMMRHGEHKNQNYPLYSFINTAQRVGSDVDYMFSRATNEDLEITSFFVYFQPKTVFSIEKQQKIDENLMSSGVQNQVLVDFSLDLIKEQPEVSLLRMLHNTQNAVICLSATSGIKGNYNGQYDRYFLNEYSNQSSQFAHLDYNVISRDKSDIQSLTRLRNEREKLRTIEFHSFNEDSLSIVKRKRSDTFIQMFDFWLKTLKYFRKDPLNPYKNQEFERELESVLLAAYDAKHSLIIGRSGQFYSAFKHYLKHLDVSGKKLPIKLLKVPDGLNNENKETKRVIELTPFENGITVRIIFFDSEFARQSDVRHYTKVDNKNTKLAFVSHYKGAGTGLNYFVTYLNALNNTVEKIKDFEEDFERLVLITSPFYSQVKSGQGLNSLENFMTLMKHYASSHETKLLKDFDVNLVNGENYQILMREHEMELFKVLMQAIGRVERRDTIITTDIFMPKDMLDNAIMQFANIERNSDNLMMLESMSLLNYKLKEYCIQLAQGTSFKSALERDEFELSIRKGYEHLNYFFDDFVPKVLEEARCGSLAAVSFNQALRHIDCVKNPTAYIARLKKTSPVKNDPYISDILNHMFIDMSDGRAHINLCREHGDYQILTDISKGDYYYEPTHALFKTTGRLNDKGLASNLINSGRNLVKQAYLTWVPNPAAMALFKGNVGEYLFNLLLEKCNVKINALSPEQIMEYVGCRAYELFDEYIEINNELLCIDVKNWTSTFDKEDMAKKAHRKALGKIDSILENTGSRYENIRFIYLNTRIEYNELNTKAEVNKNADLYYLNLFKFYESYVEGKLQKELKINDKLLLLLNKEYN